MHYTHFADYCIADDGYNITIYRNDREVYSADDRDSEDVFRQYLETHDEETLEAFDDACGLRKDYWFEKMFVFASPRDMGEQNAKRSANHG